MNILVTGGAGFMGSHFTRYLVNKYPEHKIINFDKITYAGNLNNLKEIENKPNYKFIKGDLRDFNFLVHILKDIDVLFNFAAESHVDNSEGDSLRFTSVNCFGTHVLLEAARVNKVSKIIHISTDEVYGDIIEGSFDERDRLSPTNNYSASKAAAEMIIKGYLKTYKIPLIVVRGCNNYGPNQYPEKIIPCFITKLLQGKKVPLHGTGENIRTYVHVSDFCKAVDLVYNKGKIGEVYNISTFNEISNIDLTRKILSVLGKDESDIEFVKDRPFNDKRYSINSAKLRSLGWRPEINFEEGIKDTIEWYKKNVLWWEPLVNKERMPLENENI